MEKPDSLDIDRVAFIGRTYREYMWMFGLDESVCENGPMLDCPAGPSSFTAEARGRVSRSSRAICSMASPRRLVEKGKGDIDHVFEKLDEVTHLYTWTYYKDK